MNELTIINTLLSHAARANGNPSGRSLVPVLDLMNAVDEIRTLVARVDELESAALLAASDWAGDQVDTGAATVQTLPTRRSIAEIESHLEDM